jgi:hypothetical protein
MELYNIFKSCGVTNLTDLIDLFNLIYLNRKGTSESTIIDQYNDNRKVEDMISQPEEEHSIKPRLLYKILRTFFQGKGLKVHSTDYGTKTPEMDDPDLDSAINYLFTTLGDKWEEFSNTENHRDACSLIFPM